MGAFHSCRDRRPLVVFPALIVASVTLAAQAPADRTFRSTVELVALNVTATDAQQRFVSDLGADEFVVFEDGVRQEIQFFAHGQLPLDLIVLLDTSASMKTKWDVVRRAAAGFVRTLAPGDRGALVGFARQATVLQPLTGDVEALVGAIDGLSPTGVTALYTTIYVALKQFGRPAQQTGEVRRQALVVLSDGYDTVSPLPFDALLDEARTTGVAIYTIRLQPPPGLLAKLDGRASAAQYAMRALAEETGARAFVPRHERDLEAIYGEIGSELAHQYAIAYQPPARSVAGLRKVDVRLASRADVRIRTRSSYVAKSTTRPDR